MIPRRVKNRHGGSPAGKMASQALHQARSGQRDGEQLTVELDDYCVAMPPVLWCRYLAVFEL
jgi:hypothetical protein